ncbi:MAG: N-acyl-D-amino-acid deacylase family protein [Syntrophomonadaceae bacterium]
MKLLRIVSGPTLAFLLLAAAPEESPRSLLIAGGRVADGTGAPLSRADVRVQGDRIVEVGTLSPKEGETVIRAEGRVVAPGFIDVHNHSTRGLKTDPLAETQVSQGITTLVLGPDGDSPWPIGEYLAGLEKAPAAVNVMTMVGHETVRSLVMGEDFRRKATPEEIVKMAGLVELGMREGAAGLSSGLEYDVGSYASTDELVSLAKPAARYGGFYMTHVRDEAEKTFAAFDEAIRIGKEGGLPLQISHIKMGTIGVWGKAKEAVALIDRVRAKGQDVTADCYPYEAWHSNLEVIVPDKQYDNPASVSEALRVLGGPSRITVTACKSHPAYAGKTLEEIAKSEGMTPVALYSKMVREGGADIIGHSMKTEDVEVYYVQPWVMVASDGGIANDHPRGAGTFTRVLGRFVRERHLFTLEEAVRKMTSLPASRMKLSDRGRVAPNLKADLVVFDPETVIDRSTFEEPRRLSEGISLVLVNGEAVWSDGKATGARPGRVLRSAGKP